MRCSHCGHEEVALKTCRWRSSEWWQTFTICDRCYAPLADRLWVRAGPFTVTSRCERCGSFCHPRDLVESRPGGHGKRDLVSTGVCVSCDNGGSRR